LQLKLSPFDAGNKSRQNTLKSILQQYSRDKDRAKIPVVAVIEQGRKRYFVCFGPDFWVPDDERIIQPLQNAGFEADSGLLLTAPSPPTPSPTGRGAELLPRPLGSGLGGREGKTNVFFL